MSSKKKVTSNLNNKSNIENTPTEDIVSNETVHITNVKIDKDSEKYKVALKFVNKILVNIGKEEVAELIDFKDIDREDIIKEVNKESFREMENELFEQFDKVKMGWYRRNIVSSYILTFLRNMCTDLGYSFTYHELKKQKNKIVKSEMLYSIKLV